MRSDRSLKLAAVSICAVSALCALPALAHAKGDKDDEPAEGKSGPPNVAASLEFMLGLNNNFEVQPDGGKTSKADGKTTFGIVPGFDKMLGRNFGVGGEYMFVWAGSDAKGAASDRSLIMSPHLRARMSFPIVQNFTFDGMIGLGPTIWVGNDTSSGVDKDTRFGWSLRFGFGGGYKFNDSVAAFLNVGYYTTTSYGDDMRLNLNTVPVSVGLRSSF